MKTLTELNCDASLARVTHDPAPLALERQFTATHRRFAEAHAATREAACLRVLFPAILQPIGEGDLLAGRICYPLVAFSPEPMGLGYSCQFAVLDKIAADHPAGSAARAAAEELIAYWRPRTTAGRVRAAYPAALAARLPSDDWTNASGVGFPLYRIAGISLDFPKLLALGLPGLRAELARRLTAADAAAAPLLTAALAALDLLAGSLAHYAHEAAAKISAAPTPARAAELRELAGALTRLVTAAPATLLEAMQLAWLYSLHSGVWNYGRADSYLGPFLARDLAAGRLTETGAQRLIESWWRLMKAYDNQYNNRVFLGGVGRTDEAAADRFALLAIAATRAVRLNQPQLSLRFHAGQNPALMAAALDALGEGCTFPILYNDDVNLPAVARAFAVPHEEAIHYLPFGCGEYALDHRSVGSPNGVINLAKALELALHNGTDPLTGRQAGPATGDPAAFAGFEDLWRAYAAQVEHLTGALAEAQRIGYEVTGRDAAFLFASILNDDCLARGRALLDGGVRHLGGTLETYGNTNAADALTALDRVVFRERRAALPAIIAACADNFASPAGVTLRSLLQAAPKYGNDDPAADAMARRVHEHVCTFTRDQAARVGLDSYLVVIINNWANVIFGRTTGASADGRGAGEPLANANNPSPGNDRQGVTAFLNSLVQLDPSLHAGAVQNMKFSPALFRAQRPKLEALLAAYWAGGGAQAMITVVARADLEAALLAPEKWGHLMVRVGGFSIRFIDLPRDAQLEVLHRTFHE